jgi:hypothetical protein
MLGGSIRQPEVRPATLVASAMHALPTMRGTALGESYRGYQLPMGPAQESRERKA